MSPQKLPAYAALDARHVWHPFTQAATAAPPLPIASASGAVLRTVITSYSIHYTKLYEPGGRGRAA